MTRTEFRPQSLNAAVGFQFGIGLGQTVTVFLKFGEHIGKYQRIEPFTLVFRMYAHQVKIYQIVFCEWL